MVDIIEAGMDGYSFVVKYDTDEYLQEVYVVERLYLHLDENDAEVWSTERQTYHSWVEFLRTKGDHLFTLPPVQIHLSHREKLQRELDNNFGRQSKSGIHPYWRILLNNNKIHARL